MLRTTAAAASTLRLSTATHQASAPTQGERRTSVSMEPFSSQPAAARGTRAGRHHTHAPARAGRYPSLLGRRREGGGAGVVRLPDGGSGTGSRRAAGDTPPPLTADRRAPDQASGAGYVGYSTPETCWTTRTTWQE
ncbi:hypothetical protein TPA0905_67530 [Streptomyces olivaceus]|nr:hypothetical protein TPA0905_67530 [Streptomyces olivaceus]